MVGCREDMNDYYLTRAEELMEEYPDSSSACLEKVVIRDETPENIRAQYALLWTQTSHKCHRKLENDSLIDIAINHYTKSGDKHRLAKAFLYKGLIYRENKEAEPAAEAFARSEQCFEGIADNKYKGLLYNFFGLLMYEQTNYKEASRYYKKALVCELRLDSINYAVSTCTGIASIYRLLDKPDSAKVYYELGLSYKGRLSAKRYYTLLKSYADFLRMEESYAEAEQLLRECENGIKEDEPARLALYSCFASLYYDTRRYTEALAYAEKMLESKDSVMLRGAFLHLSRIHKKLGNEAKGVCYYDKYRFIASDIRMRLKTAEVAAIPHRVASEVQTEKRHRAENGKLLWGGIACLIAVVLLFVGRAYKRRKQMAAALETEKRVLEADAKILKAEAENLKVKTEDLELEKKRLWGEAERLKTENENLDKTVRVQNSTIVSMKGILTLKNTRIEKMGKRGQAELDQKQKKIEQKREKIAQLEEDKRKEKQKKREAQNAVEQLKEEQKKMQMKLRSMTYEQSISRLMEKYLTNGGCDEKAITFLKHLKAIDLHEIKSDNISAELGVKFSEVSDILAELMKRVHPEAVVAITQGGVTSEKRRNVRYMELLGVDELKVVSLVLCIGEDTVRKYRVVSGV